MCYCCIQLDYDDIEQSADVNADCQNPHVRNPTNSCCAQSTSVLLVSLLTCLTNYLKVVRYQQWQIGFTNELMSEQHSYGLFSLKKVKLCADVIVSEAAARRSILLEQYPLFHRVPLVVPMA